MTEDEFIILAHKLGEQFIKVLESNNYLLDLNIKLMRELDELKHPIKSK